MFYATGYKVSRGFPAPYHFPSQIPPRAYSEPSRQKGPLLTAENVNPPFVVLFPIMIKTFFHSRKISLADVNQLIPKHNPLTVFSKIHEIKVSIEWNFLSYEGFHQIKVRLMKDSSRLTLISYFPMLHIYFFYLTMCRFSSF